MTRIGFAVLAWLGSLALTLAPQVASAASSAELYTGASYGYGRFEARVSYAAGDGVVSSFFMWKDGSEKPDTFWNELDFEKVGADCHLETNPIYGNPSTVHSQRHALDLQLCNAFHVYSYEWTPEYIAWLVDGAEIRRETGATAQAFAGNASAGMQIHLNVWPGDASFGGNFSPSILPVHQYVDWVQFSSYADGVFTLNWREDFDGSAVPSNWLIGTWGSPKNLSTHDTRNVNFIGGCAVLSLTADDATGTAGAIPCTSSGGGNAGGMPSGGGAGAGASGTAGAGGVPGGVAGARQAEGAAGAIASSGPTSSTAGASEGGGKEAGAAPVSPTPQAGSAASCSFVARDEARQLFAALGALALALVIRRAKTSRAKDHESCSPEV